MKRRNFLQFLGLAAVAPAVVAKAVTSKPSEAARINAALDEFSGSIRTPPEHDNDDLFMHLNEEQQRSAYLDGIRDHARADDEHTTIRKNCANPINEFELRKKWLAKAKERYSHLYSEA